jgi:hypothetical protein
MLTDRKKIEMLNFAREKILAGWCREHTASDKDGNPIEYTSSEATHFSLAGALHLAEHNAKISTISQGHGDLHALCGQFARGDIAKFNQQATRAAEVVTLLDKAITAVKSANKTA